MPRRRVNLLPREVEAHRKQRRLVTNAIAAGVVALMLLVLVYFVETLRVGSAHNDLKVQQAANAHLQTQINELAEFDQLQQQVKQKTDLVKALTRTEVRWSVVLADISLVIPSDAWLTGLTGSVSAVAQNGVLGSLSANGVTFSHLDVAKWLTQLAGVDEFMNAYLSLSSKAVIGATPVVNFTSSFDLSAKALRSNQAGAERQP